jgi:ATP-dependent protease HslVU (ClpYQ) peptidase subunit
VTCIVGMIDGDEVVMGGDSASSDSNWNMSLHRAPKVFNRGDYIIGLTGSPRASQLLQYSLDVADRLPARDVLDWMATDFVDAVRKAFQKGGYEKKENERAEGADAFLIGYDGRLFTMWSDYQIAEYDVPFAAVGCGYPYAIGALYAIKDDATEPGKEYKVRLALETAERFSAGVRGPFTILRGGKKLACPEAKEKKKV